LANSAPILGGRQVIVIGGVFLLLVASAMALVFGMVRLRERYTGIELHCSGFWPFYYVFMPDRHLPEHSVEQILFVAGLSAGFVTVVRGGSCAIHARIRRERFWFMWASFAVSGIPASPRA
jgi:hypothetical protein